jgi:phosphomannomutase
MSILTEDFKTYGKEIIDNLTRYAQEQAGWSLAPNHYEGVRVNLDEEHGNGWFLLRLSLHDPILPLNIESNSIGGAHKIAIELAKFIENYEMLNMDKLRSFIKSV